MRLTKEKIPNDRKAVNDIGGVFQNDAENERYKRYKKICYRQLALKALIGFLLGVLVCFLFEQI